MSTRAGVWRWAARREAAERYDIGSWLGSCWFWISYSAVTVGPAIALLMVRGAPRGWLARALLEATYWLTVAQPWITETRRITQAASRRKNVKADETVCRLIAGRNTGVRKVAPNRWELAPAEGATRPLRIAALRVLTVKEPVVLVERDGSLWVVIQAPPELSDWGPSEFERLMHGGRH